MEEEDRDRVGVIVSSGIGGCKNWRPNYPMHERGEENSTNVYSKSSFKHGCWNIDGI